MVVDNWLIEEPVIKILERLQQETHGDYLQDIKRSTVSYIVTCPFHAGHHERHASCGVFFDDYRTFKQGDYHCFTCGEHGHIWQLVAKCLECSDDYAKQWLIDNYGSQMLATEEYVDIKLPERPSEETILEEVYGDKKRLLNDSILDTFEDYHPYMQQRKLTKEVVDKFKIKYDRNTDSLVFPLWDMYGNLIMLTRRSVGEKTFQLFDQTEKEVYLLNYFTLNNYFPQVVICESQINALTLWTYNIPSIAFLGTGSQTQYEKLEKSGLHSFILALDGDEAGDKGIKRFIEYFKYKKGFQISYLVLPRGKDINDLTKEELFNLKEIVVK